MEEGKEIREWTRKKKLENISEAFNKNNDILIIKVAFDNSFAF